MTSDPSYRPSGIFRAQCSQRCTHPILMPWHRNLSVCFVAKLSPNSMLSHLMREISPSMETDACFCMPAWCMGAFLIIGMASRCDIWVGVLLPWGASDLLLIVLTVLTKNYVQQAVCSPTRTSLLSGRWVACQTFCTAFIYLFWFCSSCYFLSLVLISGQWRRDHH